MIKDGKLKLVKMGDGRYALIFPDEDSVNWMLDLIETNNRTMDAIAKLAQDKTKTE